jgi:hypothetical protein
MWNSMEVLPVIFTYSGDDCIASCPINIMNPPVTYHWGKRH